MHSKRVLVFAYLIIPSFMLAVGFILGIGTQAAWERIETRLGLDKKARKDSPLTPMHLDEKSVVSSQETMDKLENWIKNYPESWKLPQIFLDLHILYLKQKDETKSRHLFVQAQKRWQNTLIWDFVSYHWAKNLCDMQDMEQGEKILQELLAPKAWTEPEILKELGMIALRQGKKELAFQYWKRLESEYPHSEALRILKRNSQVKKSKLFENG